MCWRQSTGAPGKDAVLSCPQKVPFSAAVRPTCILQLLTGLFALQITPQSTGTDSLKQPGLLLSPQHLVKMLACHQPPYSHNAGAATHVAAVAGATVMTMLIDSMHA